MIKKSFVFEDFNVSDYYKQENIKKFPILPTKQILPTLTKETKNFDNLEILNLLKKIFYNKKYYY
jgi:hypothetical protein